MSTDDNHILQQYVHKLLKLRQGVTRYGKAPHKPVLLVSIMDEIERGNIKNHKIPLTPELLAAFKENWSLLVDTPHTSDIMLPFYYLSGEGFWKQIARDGTEVKVIIESFKIFSEYVDYAEMDKALFDLLAKPESRNYLKTVLLDTYFPQTKHNYIIRKNGGGYIHDIEKSILKEDGMGYVVIPDTSEDENRYLRGGLFKKLVPKVYDFRCCITGMKVISSHDYSMLDACHIQPVSAEGPDEVTNGLSLCPNLHRAFDKGLITVNPDYQVLVSPAFAEDEGNDYSLKRLHGRNILLPFGEKHYPGREYLAWHREMVWKG